MPGRNRTKCGGTRRCLLELNFEPPPPTSCNCIGTPIKSSLPPEELVEPNLEEPNLAARTEKVMDCKLRRTRRNRRASASRQHHSMSAHCAGLDWIGLADAPWVCGGEKKKENDDGGNDDRDNVSTRDESQYGKGRRCEIDLCGAGMCGVDGVSVGQSVPCSGKSTGCNVAKLSAVAMAGDEQTG